MTVEAVAGRRATVARRGSTVKRLSRGEELFALQLRAYRLPDPEREFRFSPPRRWRFDFAWPDLRVAVEIEGGIFSGGRHTRGKGFESDCEKYNAAASDGWRVLRFTTGMVERGEAIAAVRPLVPATGVAIW